MAGLAMSGRASELAKTASSRDAFSKDHWLVGVLGFLQKVGPLSGLSGR